VNLTVNGGTLPYAFSWSNGATNEDLKGLPLGIYAVTVNDANNCTVNTSVTITQPTQISLSTSQNNVSCFGGNNASINLTVSGATAPYRFNWSNGRTTEDINGLVAGLYTVTVSDANNCISVTSVSISQPALLTANLLGSNVSCFGGSNGAVNLTAAGGTLPYSFIWSNGSTTEDISGLTIGNYAVTVSDANACTSTFSTSVSASPCGSVCNPAGNLIVYSNC
jgi:hypothetical protein